MGVIGQTREIVLLNLRSIPSRLGASLVIVVGIAGVAVAAEGLTPVIVCVNGGGTVREPRPPLTRGSNTGICPDALAIDKMPAFSLAFSGPDKAARSRSTPCASKSTS